MSIRKQTETDKGRRKEETYCFCTSMRLSQTFGADKTQLSAKFPRWQVMPAHKLYSQSSTAEMTCRQVLDQRVGWSLPLPGPVNLRYPRMLCTPEFILRLLPKAALKIVIQQARILSQKSRFYWSPPLQSELLKLSLIDWDVVSWLIFIQYVASESASEYHQPSLIEIPPYFMQTPYDILSCLIISRAFVAKRICCELVSALQLNNSIIASKVLVH